MSLCVRYFNKMTLNIVERCLGFKPLNDLSADSVANTIKQCLSDVQLPVTCCIAQSYDGAAVMPCQASTKQKGAGHDERLTTMREASGNPCSYVHCHAHRST